MASTLSLKRRIQAAQNVSKTTRAMQMIAASKLKKAQHAALSARIYAEKLTALSKNLTSKIEEGNLHPYMKNRKNPKKSLIVIIAPDKGLCGSLITNIMKEFIGLQGSLGSDLVYVTIGKKIQSKIATFKSGEILAAFSFGTILPTFDMVYPITRIIDEYFMGKIVDNVEIIYSRFVNVFTQTPMAETVLPIKITQELEEKNKNFTYLFEPSLNVLLPTLLQHYLQMSVYRLLLESFASEQASRMISMQNATNNAKDVISELRLEYNKSRQAKITNEILDITNTGVKNLR